jgi:hypothetical protein
MAHWLPRPECYLFGVTDRLLFVLHRLYFKKGQYVQASSLLFLFVIAYFFIFHSFSRSAWLRLEIGFPYNVMMHWTSRLSQHYTAIQEVVMDRRHHLVTDRIAGSVLRLSVEPSSAQGRGLT